LNSIKNADSSLSE